MKENSIKNERSSIEEYVKILERFSNENVIYGSTVGMTLEKYKDLQLSAEHILQDYKRVLKENEDLKEEREIVGIPVRNKRDGKIGIVLHQWKNGSVAVLESINPRVINTHDSWNTLEIVTDEVKQTQTKCETIPVSLVQKQDEIDIDSIEEIKLRPSDREHLSFGGLIFEEKINKLVQAVKQLNKEVKELKKI